MKVKFLQDFRGRETNEQYFVKGEEWDFPPEVAERLIVDGRAEAVLEDEQLPELEPEKTVKKRRAHVH